MGGHGRWTWYVNVMGGHGGFIWWVDMVGLYTRYT